MILTVICHTRIDYFRLFYTQYLADLLVTHTNAYHTWCLENKWILTPDYQDKVWYNVTFSEMQAYLGLNILFSLSPSAHTRDYWSSDPFLGNTFVKNIMPEKWFEKITQYLHCSNRRSKPPKGSPTGCTKSENLLHHSHRYFSNIRVHQNIVQLMKLW